MVVTPLRRTLRTESQIGSMSKNALAKIIEATTWGIKYILPPVVALKNMFVGTMDHSIETCTVMKNCRFFLYTCGGE